MSDIQALISVIIPVYNVEKYINCCVESIREQTYKNLEIILVDDGSPDNCPRICDEWAEKDARIKVIHKENGGLSDARNAGMAAANGFYVGFVDSDDWIAPEMYERLVDAMKRDRSDIAACSVKMVWEDASLDRMLILTPHRVLSREDAQKALIKEKLLKHPVWYKLYKREQIQGIPFEVKRYHEDVYWSYKAIGAAASVSLIEYVGYNYFQRSDSIMGAGYSLTRLDALRAYCKRYKYMKREFPDLADMALAAIWSRCIYDGQQAMLYLPKQEEKKAFDFLLKIRSNYPIRYEVYRDKKFTHRMWLSLSRLSLRMVCVIRNKMRIGL